MNNSSKHSLLNNSQPGESAPARNESGRATQLRRFTGLASGALAVVFMVWLPLGILGVVPFELEIPGESSLRTHAGAAVACLMVTAWAFWEA